MEPKELIHQYLLGNLSPEQVQELDGLLTADADLRREFRMASEMDTALRDTSMERSIEAVHDRSSGQVAPAHSKPESGRWVFALVAALAASVMLVVGWWTIQPSPIATLISSEDAAWESTLPTRPGSELTAGTLNLKTGIATIRFHSGAELVIEAPTRVQLLSEMKAKLSFGAATMEVPEGAEGFVLETPDGFAVDYGTRFAVNVDEQRKTSEFELIEGEIEVHNSTSGESLRLSQAGAAASVSLESLDKVEGDSLGASANLAEDTNGKLIRIATQARCSVAMHNEKRRQKAVRTGYLYASHTDNGKWDMRSYFAFDVPSIEVAQIKRAKLRINQVESYRGSSLLLPKTNRFAVYGLLNTTKADWISEPSWAQSPGSGSGVLVGTFEIPRSRMRGIVEIETPEFMAFLKKHQGRTVTLLLTRETGRIAGSGPAMPHMFASDSHPEAVGPLLELTID